MDTYIIERLEHLQRLPIRDEILTLAWVPVGTASGESSFSALGTHLEAEAHGFAAGFYRVILDHPDTSYSTLAQYEVRAETTWRIEPAARTEVTS